MPHRHVFFLTIPVPLHVGPPEQGAEQDRGCGHDINAAHAFQHVFGQEFLIGEGNEDGDRCRDDDGGSQARASRQWRL